MPEIACLGSYIDRKGIQYSVPVLNRLMQKYPTLRVRFLGTGCAIEKVLADFSEAVRDRITVVPAFPKHDLPKLLRGAQVLVFPSLSEGFPLAVPEAMACGLAPIVTDIPGPTEIIVNDVNGLVVPPRDCERLEGAIELLLNDPDYLNTLRRLAYQTVQGYSWSKIAAQHLELYTSALERQKVGKPEKTVVMQG
ncbi:MAG: glycosyltransferase family 4 protein [Alkalinema sp. RU_4_3]|nr:glycosyltransferase family 4 protein [Alkalinema sp. RU_4_3]